MYKHYLSQPSSLSYTKFSLFADFKVFSVSFYRFQGKKQVEMLVRECLLPISDLDWKKNHQAHSYMFWGFLTAIKHCIGIYPNYICSLKFAYYSAPPNWALLKFSEWFFKWCNLIKCKVMFCFLTACEEASTNYFSLFFSHTCTNACTMPPTLS